MKDCTVLWLMHTQLMTCQNFKFLHSAASSHFCLMNPAKHTPCSCNTGFQTQKGHYRHTSTRPNVSLSAEMATILFSTMLKVTFMHLLGYLSVGCRRGQNVLQCAPAAWLYYACNVGSGSSISAGQQTSSLSSGSLSLGWIKAVGGSTCSWVQR